MKWVIIDIDKLTRKIQCKTKARMLPSGQAIVRVCEHNEDLLSDYIKYNQEQLSIMNLSEEITKHKEINEHFTKNSPFDSKELEDGHKLFKRFHGDKEGVNPFIQILPGDTEIIDISIDYDWAKIESMEVIGAGKQHSASLLILDTDNNDLSGAPLEVYGPNIPINQFAFNVGIAEGYHKFHSKYDADLQKTMIVQVEITNHSTEASNVALNLELNEVSK